MSTEINLSFLVGRRIIALETKKRILVSKRWFRAEKSTLETEERSGKVLAAWLADENEVGVLVRWDDGRLSSWFFQDDTYLLEVAPVLPEVPAL